MPPYEWENINFEDIFLLYFGRRWSPTPFPPTPIFETSEINRTFTTSDNAVMSVQASQDDFSPAQKGRNTLYTKSLMSVVFPPAILPILFLWGFSELNYRKTNEMGGQT